MLETALSAFVMIIWWFGAGPFLMFFNSVGHSDTNFEIRRAKENGKSTFLLRIKQLLHVIGYVVWVVVLVAIPILFKIYMN